MKISRNDLRIIVKEEIRKLGPGCYKVYPKKPRQGKKRREALSKKCKTKAAAKKHLAAIEISKSRNESIDEAYIKRYVADPQGGAIRQELVDAPPRFERDFLQQVYSKFYNERQVELVNRQRSMEGLPGLTYDDRKGFLNYTNKLDSNTLYNLQLQAYEEARNLMERYVNEQMQVNPKTRSDYPGQGTKLVDATRRSQLFFTDNDFKTSYPNPENIAFQDIQRVAMLSSNELEGVAPGAIQFSHGQQGKDIDAYVDMMAAEADKKKEKTDPSQGESVVNTSIGTLKRPKNFIPDPSFVSVPIVKDDEYDDGDTYL